MALGDQGTGEADQARVAAAIGTTCQRLRCDFALALGDNIYDAGPSGPDDPQFDAKFEVPYANLTFPFFLVLGNHDNGDPAGSPASGLGPWHETGDHEVAYTYRTDRASQKWSMPARAYVLQSDGGAQHVFWNGTPGNTAQSFGPSLADFFALDTNALVYRDLRVPPDPDAAWTPAEWIASVVPESTAPWRIAFGHHPYVSNGPHGNAGDYDGRPGVPGLSGDHLKSFFEENLCGKVDLYLSGHDHNLQWLDPVPSCGDTQFVTSGAGGAATYPLPGDNPTRFQAETLGFWWFDITPGSAHLIAFDADGKTLFQGTLTKPPPPATAPAR